MLSFRTFGQKVSNPERNPRTIMKPGLHALRLKFPRTSRAFRTDPRPTRGPPSENEFLRPARGRQALYVGNINPTTNYALLRETFKTLPAFAGFRMTRHPTAPVGFVQFKSIKSAVNAYQRLKHTTLVVEGRQLDIRYANPREVHPDSQPQFNCDLGDEQSSSSPTPSSPFGPSNTLFIRPKNVQAKPRHADLKKVLRKLPGFRTVRFRSKFLPLCFVEFDSVNYATQAMKTIQATHKLDNWVASYASPKIEREPTDQLLLRVPNSSSTFDEGAFKKALSRLPGLLSIRSHVTRNETLDSHWIATFDSAEAATNARDQIVANPKTWRSTEASFFAEQKNYRTKAQPDPSAALYISNIAQETSARNLKEYFSQFQGFRNLVLPRSSRTREDAELPGQHLEPPHSGWAIVNFENVADAQRALDTTNGQRLSGSSLKVSFKTESSASESKDKNTPPVVTNVLFCRELFGVTPEELHEAFEKYEGFKRAQLYPDGKDSFMPYARVIFDSSGSAVNALESLKSQPIKIGQSDLPIVVEPLRLRKGQKHWKWTRPMR
ncbi:hypothetical protein FS837_007192 [Tulasnella sp. UAMH 9824]|nr:hypothetical protein FS837_007192 [Tulasnella sp. UAMH 9824]